MLYECFVTLMWAKLFKTIIPGEPFQSSLIFFQVRPEPTQVEHFSGANPIKKFETIFTHTFVSLIMLLYPKKGTIMLWSSLQKGARKFTQKVV